jgi:hypothetical protein
MQNTKPRCNKAMDWQDDKILRPLVWNTIPLMKTWIFRFTAKQLGSMHPDHLGFILASSHCCNELTSLSPYLIFEQNSLYANEVEKSFIQIRFFTIVRMQIAKIFEYRDLCNGYVGRIRKTFPATAEKVAERTRTISRQINSARWAETVRNKVAFHFDAQYAVQCLKNLPQDESLSFIVGRMRGITSFDFADRVLVGSMFLEAGSGDHDAGQDIVKNWTIGLQNRIVDFHAQTMEELCNHYGLLGRREECELRDQYCATKGEICIPLSTSEPRN